MSDDEASSIALVWQLQMEQEQQQAARQARFYPFRASNFEPELPRMRRPVGLERFNGQMDIDPDNLSYEVDISIRCENISKTRDRNCCNLAKQSAMLRKNDGVVEQRT